MTWRGVVGDVPAEVHFSLADFATRSVKISVFRKRLPLVITAS